MDSITNKNTIMIMVANLGIGGQEKMAILLAEQLRLVSNVIFLTFNDWDGAKYDSPKGVNCINLSISNKRNITGKIINVIKRVIAVRRIKNNKSVTYSISFGETANIVNALSNNKGYLISSIRHASIAKHAPTIVDRIIMRNSDKVVFISYGLKNAYANHFKNSIKKMKVIYNAVDVNSIEAMAQKAIDSDIEIDDLTLISVGRLTSGKCFKNMINSIAIVKRAMPGVKLLIIGEGDEETILREQIKEKQLDKTVFLLGAKSNPYSYVSRSRCFLNASYSESFSNVVLEALACGIPVISTDCMFGPREILSGEIEYNKINSFEIKEYGILTPCFNPRSTNQHNEEKIFAEAIIYLLSKPDLESRLKANAKKRSNVFSIDKHINYWYEMLYKREEQ